MLEILMGYYNALLRIVESAPPWMWPMLAGWLVSWGITQRVKFWMPLAWSNRVRAILCQSVAFWSGFAITAMLWTHTPRYPNGYIVAGIVGIWSPLTYAIMARVLERFAPGVREAWSGDTREMVAPAFRVKPGPTEENDARDP